MNLSLGSKGDSYRHDYVNFSHPCVNHTIVRFVVEIEQLGVDQIQGDVEVLEAPCGDGVWHIERCPLTLHVQCSVLQKGLIAYHKSNGITTMKKHIKSNHFGLLKQFLEQETNLAPRSSLDHEPNKKAPHVSPFVIYNFSSTTNKFKKDDCNSNWLLKSSDVVCD